MSKKSYKSVVNGHNKVFADVSKRDKEGNPTKYNLFMDEASDYVRSRKFKG